MDVKSIQGNAGPGVSVGVAGASSGTLASSQSNANDAMMGGVNKSDFLKLLVAQLRNQDPMKPMEDKEFISQMAQLNTVEQLANMNNALAEFMGLQQMSQASALIGKTVEAVTFDGSLVNGVVQEVRIDADEAILMVNGQEIAVGEIDRISPGT